MAVSTTEADCSGDPRLVAPAVDQIGRLARSGAGWSLVLTVANQAISVIATAVLARVLLPSDYGIMGMVATVTALLGAVSSMGLSWSTIQRRELTENQIHNLFWINGAFGVLLWVAAAAVAPVVAEFYAQPQVGSVLLVLGVTFALSGFAVQPAALMQRRMLFRRSTTVTLASQSLGAIAAFCMAFAGFGYWALVGNGIVTQAARLALTFAVSGYRAGRPRRDPATVALVRFGGLMALSSIVAYVSRNVDNVIVGRVWGAEELGYYSRAYFLMTWPAALLTGSLEQVMIPALSALTHDRQRMHAAYLTAFRALVFAGFPVAMGLAITAPEAVRLVYGVNWSPVVPILAWFSASMLVMLVVGSGFWLFVTSGHGRRLVLIRVARAVCFGAAALAGVRYGPVGVAAAYAIASALLFMPELLMSHRAAGFPLSPTIRLMLPILAATLLMATCSWTAGYVADALWGAWYLTLPAKVATGTLTYGFIAVNWLGPWPIPLAERYRTRFLRRLRRDGQAVMHAAR